MNTHDDIVNELLDDEALDPKKLFDEKEYNTLIIDRGGFNKKQNDTADLLEHLLDPGITRIESEEVFSKLKEMKATALLVDAIQSAERTEEKVILTAACWETGLDFSKNFLFFVGLACDDDFKLAMEALTVIEYTDEAIDETILNQALAIVEQNTSKNEALISDLIQNINSRLN